MFSLHNVKYDMPHIHYDVSFTTAYLTITNMVTHFILVVTDDYYCYLYIILYRGTTAIVNFH